MSDPNAPAPRGLLNWWQGLILAVASAILGVVAAVLVMKGDGSSSTNAPSWAMILLRFVPHFLLLFGILADAFTYEGVYWTGTMVGVLATFVAPLLDRVAEGATALFARMFSKGAPSDAAAAVQAGGLLAGLAMKGGDGDYSGCNLMSGADSTSKSGIPQTLTVTSSILAYYIFDLMMNLSVIDAAGAIVAALVLFAGQAAAISGCVDSIGKAVAIAGVYGFIIGGTFYGIMSTWGPEYLPSSVLAGSSTSGGPNGPGGPGRKGMGMSGGANGDGGAGFAGGSGQQAAAASCPR